MSAERTPAPLHDERAVRLRERVAFVAGAVWLASQIKADVLPVEWGNDVVMAATREYPTQQEGGTR